MEASEAEHMKALEGLKAEHEKARKVFAAESVEAQKINAGLLLQLGQHEQMIDEAVAMICRLEEKIGKLESTSTPIVSSMTEQHVQPEIMSNEDTLPQLEIAVLAPDPKTPESRRTYHGNTLSATPSSDSSLKSPRTAYMFQRAPIPTLSSLGLDSGSAGGLRSLYLEGEKTSQESPEVPLITRPLSALSGDNDGDSANLEDHYRMRSPPLSILSKSSFQSIYGTPEGPVISLKDVSSSNPNEKPHHIDQNSSEDNSSERQIIPRIRKWMDDKESPLRSRYISPRRGFTEPIVSIDSLLGREELIDWESYLRSDDSAKPFDDITVTPSPDTMLTINESLHDSSSTSAPSHRSQEVDTRSPSADSYAGEFARFQSSFGSLEWFGPSKKDPKPKESTSIGEGESSLYQDNDQDSSELPAPWTGIVPERMHETSSAAASLVPHGNDMMFNGDDYLPTEYGVKLRYKYYPPHGESPPHPMHNVSQSSESATSPAGQAAEMESPRARNVKHTPSPLKVSQHMQGHEKPKAQHYQRLVTPPSDQKSTMTDSDTGSKLPRLSSARTTPSSLSLTPLLPLHPLSSYSVLPKSQSPSIKAQSIQNMQQENSPLAQHPSLEVGKRRTCLSTTAPSLLPRASRPSLPQRTPPSRIARPGASGSAQPQRASSSILPRRATRAVSTDTTTITSEEEGILTPSTNSRDDSTLVSEDAQGRKWGAKLGRTASLKIKQGFGWKKGKV